jgi:thiol-disulfide isomerase/thioredoxin
MITTAGARMTHRSTLCIVVGLLLSVASLFGSEGDALIGKTLPDWTGAKWINSAPIQLPQLAGKVVLIRWWTAPACPYCRATAPALNEFYRAYREQGLEVLGFYHHKSGGPIDIDAVKQYARTFGFQFPVAIDPEWRTLKEWWLNADDHRWTSVSFLLDRHGVVRHIHPGGQYVKGDPDYRLMKSKIEELLAESR